MQIVVQAPMKTKDILQLLRDWEPIPGVKFTLAKRKSFVLTFDVSTPSAAQACRLAQQRIKEAGFEELPGLSVTVAEEENKK